MNILLRPVEFCNQVFTHHGPWHAACGDADSGAVCPVASSHPSCWHGHNLPLGGDGPRCWWCWWSKPMSIAGRMPTASSNSAEQLAMFKYSYSFLPLSIYLNLSIIYLSVPFSLSHLLSFVSFFLSCSSCLCNYIVIIVIASNQRLISISM